MSIGETVDCETVYDGAPEYQVCQRGDAFAIVLTGPDQERLIGWSADRDNACSIAQAMNETHGL